MGQLTNLNIAPYYDDFDESDNFHRVLYRPSFAVQARELTTQQSTCFATSNATLDGGDSRFT